jgi:serine/threonine-protein kinase
MTSVADRHLLFGLLALQNGIINQGQLVAAFQAWTLDRSKSLADYLVDRGDIDEEDRAAVEALAARHLKRHGGDLENSLAAVPAGRSTRESLARLADVDITASLAHLGAASLTTVDDGDGTGSHGVGMATSDGLRFRILRPHARGGLGAVFVAHDNELHREVALKQMLDYLADDLDSRLRFLIEAEITGGLEHPGIVPVYGLGTYADGRPYYAMRFIRGDSLKEAIDAFHRRVGTAHGESADGLATAGTAHQESADGLATVDGAHPTDPGRRSLELRRLLGRFVDVCNAIDYAHSRGVLHRDIKPGNIIVGKHGETLVVDWGLAKAMGRSDPGSSERTLLPSSVSGASETLPGTALGTPAYMSPEQADGDLDLLGPRSDVYSLGATLYCLLTGQPPYTGDDAGSIRRAVRRGEFRPPRAIDPAIDAALEAVCQKAMALKPEDRYRSPRALVEDVERWMADEPVTAYRESAVRRARRWGKRNRTTVTASAVALLAGVVGLSAVLVVQTQANAALADANSKVQGRYELAMEAIKMFHTGVAEDFLLKEAQFRDLRDRQLSSALDLYGKLASMLGRETDAASRRALLAVKYEAAELTSTVGRQEDALLGHRSVLTARESLALEPGADALARVEFGRSVVAVAGLLAATGQTALALAEYRRGEGVLAGLAAGEPAARTALAACRSRMASLLSRTGKSALALAAYRLARSDQEALAVAPDASNDAFSEVADTISRIGILLSNMGKPAEAEAEFRRALAIRQRLADHNPTVTDFQGSLANSYNNLGLLLSNRGRLAAADAEYRKALAIQQELADDNPSVTDFRSRLALSHHNIGHLLSNTGRPAEAEAEYRRALAIYQRLADDNPRIPEYRRGISSSLNNIGDLFTDTGHASEAIDCFVRSRDTLGAVVKENPSVADNRNTLAFSFSGLGRARRRAGNPRAAVEDLRRAIALREGLAAITLEARYDLARNWALLAGLAAEEGTGLAPAEAKSHSDRAMNALRHVVAEGFRAPKTSTEPDFDPLRSRPDFQRLLLDLAFPAEPFAPPR